MPDFSVPAIETARLLLRGHQPDDFDACCEMWADPRVTQHIGGKPATSEEVWSRLLRYAGLWSLLGFGYWAIEEKSTGTFIGDIGFADFLRDLDPPFGSTPELGWALAPGAHGKGYAREAVTAALRWGVRELDSNRAVCLINPENSPSIRVAMACGFTAYADTVYKGAPVILYECPLRG